jgi:dsRNA-specific ribonuclease
LTTTSPVSSKPDGPVERRLGYRFSNAMLLQQALTHRSHGVPNNERLEFLGDGLLNFVVARLLFQQFTALPEGDLSRLRAGLVNQQALSATSCGWVKANSRAADSAGHPSWPMRSKL